MVAPIEEDLPTMTMPDCCLEPVYNWNFMCLPRKKLVKRVGISLYYMLTAWFSQDYHFIRVCLLFQQFLIKKKHETEKTFKIWIFKEVTAVIR